MYRLFNARRPDGGVCWSRGGGIGAARYPWVWCGDQRRDWRFLAATLKAALSAGLSGVPFMGHDLAGYMPSQETDPPPEPDVFVRGCAFACFNPMMSTHGTVTRPYDFEPGIVDIYRKFSKIHYLLVPYLLEQAHAGCAKGLPMMRHLVLQHSEDDMARDCEDEFYLGEDLLVAPVFSCVKSRDVYLPEGEWEGLFDRKLYHGPEHLAMFPAPLDNIPVFIRQPTGSALLPGIVEEIRALVD
jgi:alpha-D-xyloside xylohydrolase